MTHLQKLMQQLFENGTAGDFDGVTRRLTSVHPDADAAREGFEYQMRGTGAIGETAKIAARFADATVHDVQALVFMALAADSKETQQREGILRDMIPPKFAPQGWQWEHQGRVYQLEDLSRNDLLQLVCACMQSLERADAMAEQFAKLMRQWRRGEVDPDNDEKPASEQLLELPDPAA